MPDCGSIEFYDADQLAAVAKQHDADINQLMAMLTSHTHDTIKQVA